MKWLLGLVLLFVLVVTVVWLLGRSLPVSHETTLERVIDAPADEVWRSIEDPARWKLWRTDLEQLEALSDESFIITDSNGAIRYRLERPAERTLVTTIDQQNLPYGGQWRWTVAPATDDTSRVTITETGEIYNPFFRFFARYVFGYDATMSSVLDQLEIATRSSRES
jgi:hypothetical protein